MIRRCFWLAISESHSAWHAVQVFTSMDQTLVLNIFTAGHEAQETLKSSPKDREDILQYIDEIAVGGAASCWSGG